jgi:hypothetical protein
LCQALKERTTFPQALGEPGSAVEQRTVLGYEADVGFVLIRRGRQR